MRLALFSFVVVAFSVQQALSISIDIRASNDLNTFQVAAFLELFEVALYQSALQQFDNADFRDAGCKPEVRRHFEEIYAHEQDHFAVLASALGNKAPKACNYSFPITDVRSFIVFSGVIERLGTSAYAGAMRSLISKDYVSLFSSILAIEANQATWVDSSVGNAVPWSGSFNTPLNVSQVYSYVSQFITWCPPSNFNLGLTSFPSLNITGAFPGSTNQSVSPGQSANVQCPSNATHIAFLRFGLYPTIFVPIQNGTVDFPQNLTGEVFAVATKGSDTSDNNIVAGPAVLLFSNDTSTD